MMAAAQDFGNSPCILDAFVFVSSSAGDLFDVSRPRAMANRKPLCAHYLWNDCTWPCPDGLRHDSHNCPSLLDDGVCTLDASACPWLHVPRPPPRPVVDKAPKKGQKK